VLAQTPQVFARQLLMDAYAGGCSEGATDDASVVERFGASVHVVPGDPTNVKVTRPEDLRLAELILRAGTGAARGR
jgi:2-C-methyl-D-erythritol 4-phosphate cytidylyltransferase